jgi:hypothetical protein
MQIKRIKRIKTDLKTIYIDTKRNDLGYYKFT